MNFQTLSFLQKSDTPILVLAGRDNETYPPDGIVANFQQYEQVETVIFAEGDHAMLHWRLGKRVPPPFYVEGYLATYSAWILERCS